jgi:hypothetical protein
MLVVVVVVVVVVFGRGPEHTVEASAWFRILNLEIRTLTATKGPKSRNLEVVAWPGGVNSRKRALLRAGRAPTLLPTPTHKPAGGEERESSRLFWTTPSRVTFVDQEAHNFFSFFFSDRDSSGRPW